MKTVIFDLDGTLADTSGDLIAAANACFSALGHGAQLDPVADQLTAFHGGRAMLRLGFQRLGIEDEGLVDGEYPRLLQHYRDNIDVLTVLYPGCLEAVDGLLSAGFKVGICTNKPEGLAEILMQRLKVRSNTQQLWVRSERGCAYSNDSAKRCPNGNASSARLSCMSLSSG